MLVFPLDGGGRASVKFSALVVGLQLGHAPPQVFQFVDALLLVFVMIHHGRALQFYGARPEWGGARTVIVVDFAESQEESCRVASVRRGC